MRVSQVRTESGSPVVLDFGDSEVTIRRQSPARQRALRLGGGAALLLVGLTAVAITLDDRGNHTSGLVLWTLAALAAAAGVGGLIAWLVLAARDRRGPAEVISAGSIGSARSQVDNGRVTVSLTIGDRPERTFSADGPPGRELANRFGRLLAVPAEP